MAKYNTTKYSPAQLKRAKEKAKKYFMDNQGVVSVKVLSRVAKVPQGHIRKWMADEDWEASVKEEPEDKVILSKQTKEMLKSGAEEYGLDEQEELFCYHYLKTMNQTTSAIKAGYSPSYAHNKAYLLLKKEKIKNFIAHVKAQRNQELFIDPMRVIQEYMKIAFADMTDFLSFGPNGIALKSSNQVDGQLIIKVKEGRDGISIELPDKMKALDKLSEYLDVFPDFKRKIEEEKLRIAKERLEWDKTKGDGGTGDDIVDEWVRAVTNNE